MADKFDQWMKLDVAAIDADPGPSNCEKMTAAANARQSHFGEQVFRDSHEYFEVGENVTTSDIGSEQK